MHYNDVTGNALVTKPASNQYRSGWDAIFGKKEAVEVIATPAVAPDTTLEEDEAWAALSKTAPAIAGK